MDKILVEVYFPSLSVEYDIYIPDNVRFYQVADMIERAVFGLTSGKYVPTGDAILCDRITGTVFDINMTAKELHLHSGSRLLII